MLSSPELPLTISPHLCPPPLPGHTAEHFPVPAADTPDLAWPTSAPESPEVTAALSRPALVRQAAGFLCPGAEQDLLQLRDVALP